MELKKLFKDALIYPTKSMDKWLILGGLLVIMNICNNLEYFRFLSIESTEFLSTSVLLFIFAILGFVIALITQGYSLSIIKNTIQNVQEDAPEFDFQKNIVEGIKLFILGIVYFIIPFLITFILAFATGAFNSIYKLAPYVLNGTTNSIPQYHLVSAGLSFILPFVIGSILLITFCLLYTVAKAVLADTGNLTEASNMPDVFRKIGEIKWGNYIIWIIVLVFIQIILAIFVGAISSIPFIGLIIATLIITSFEEMFGGRALGLIYNESKS